MAHRPAMNQPTELERLLMQTVKDRDEILDALEQEWRQSSLRREGTLAHRVLQKHGRIE